MGQDGKGGGRSNENWFLKKKRFGDIEIVTRFFFSCFILPSCRRVLAHTEAIYIYRCTPDTINVSDIEHLHLFPFLGGVS